MQERMASKICVFLEIFKSKNTANDELIVLLGKCELGIEILISIT